MTLYLTNATANSATAYVQENYQGSWYPIANPAVSAYSGASPWPVTWTLSEDTARVEWRSNSVVLRSWVQYSAGTYTDTLTGAAAATYYWCVYHVNWTNTGSRFAALEYFVLDNEGQAWFPTNMQSRVVAPGMSVDFYVTNSIGTNNVGCGSLGVGDGRDQNSPVSYYAGTKYSQQSSGQSSGFGDDRPYAGTDPNRRSYSTNSPTSGDFEKVIDALGYIDADIRFGNRLLSVIGTNGNTGNWLLQYISTNHGALLDGIRTNMDGIRTNFGPLTNLSRFANIDADTSNQLGYAEGILAGVSNLVATSSVYSDMLDMQGYHDGLSGANDELITAANALTEPEAEFGRLRMTVKGRNYDLEGTRALAFDLDEPLAATGFRSWVRLILLWSMVVASLVWFGAELREGIRNVVSLPSAWSGDALPLGALSAAPGANMSIKWIGTLALVVITAFIPTLLVALMSTGLYNVGVGLTTIATWSINVITLIPAEVWKVAWALNQWFPLFESLVMALNMAAVSLAMDYLVAFVMFLSRLFQSAMPA